MGGTIGESGKGQEPVMGKLRTIKRLLWRIHRWVERVGVNMGLSTVPIFGRLAHRLFYQFRDGLLLSPVPQFVTLRGFTLRLDSRFLNKYGATCFLLDDWEPEVTAVFDRLLRPGMTVVDVGSNLGYYTLLSSQIVGSTGKVYSFEPDPVSHELLVENVVTNRYTNVHCVPKAVTDRDGECGLTILPAPRGHIVAITKSDVSIRVQTTTLDSFFASEGWPRIDLIKVDVEGSEKMVFDGMHEVAQRNPWLRLIWELDLHSQKRMGISPEDLFASLAALGFTRLFFLQAGYPSAPRDIYWLWARGGNILAERPQEYSV